MVDLSILSDVILQDSDPTLRQISEDVTEFDGALENLIGHMNNIMMVKRGYGLAAIQIGIPLRVIVAYDGEIIRAMVNPAIVRKLNRDAIEKEGCLSVPSARWRNVSRPAKCEIAWQGVDGTRYQQNFYNKMARILQHEIDHLDGVLITDKPPA